MSFQPIRTALAGFGYWGANLARNLQRASGINFVGATDPDTTRQASFAADYPAARWWPTFDALVADSEVEAVVIAAPSLLHASMVEAALSAGKHTFVEKPLTLDVGEADHLVETADMTGLTLMVGHTFLYSAPVRELRTYVETGVLGDLQYLYSQRLSLGKVRRDCNALWNFAPHDISIMMYVLNDRPIEVSARSHSFLQAGIADVFFADLSFSSGIGANLHVSWIDPRKTRLMTLVGNEKLAVYDDVSSDNKIWLYDAGIAKANSFGDYSSLGDFQWRTRSGDITLPHVALTEPLLVEMEAFATACSTGEPSLTDGTHGRDVVKVLAAIDESAALRGQPVGLKW